MKIITSLVIAAILVVSCSNEPGTQVTQSSVTPPDQQELADTAVESKRSWKERPFEDIDIAFHDYKYKKDRSLDFELESGTKVKIPSNAFEHKDGSPVTGEVVIKYREFHSISDVMLSGITMKYATSDSTEGDFETAGMFEIRAFEGEDELALKKDKTIKVDLASYKDGDFNHYKMNEESGSWEYIEKSKPQPNNDKQAGLAEVDAAKEGIEATCSTDPVEYKPQMDVFDLDYDFSHFENLSFAHEAMWICVGDAAEKATLQKSLTGHNSMELIPTDSCNVFELNVWNHGVQQEKKKFHVTPVWTGKALERAKEKYKEFIQQLKEIAEQRKMYEREADLRRSFELKGMGVYNCDRVLDYAKFVIISLAVVCKEKILDFWYITKNGQVAIKYFSPQAPAFKYDPTSRNSIMAILPGGKIGVVSEKAFEAGYQQYLKNPSSDKVLELELVPENQPVADQKDFERHVPSI